ncbi:nucleoside triphosphate hydrolase protein [Wolfiporia cocos MD-104 SS10]|uniref:RNA helicase n=1 Tax=Wolfiporia cocos (strain MD-104) TaxID=742152 RepID=A0A2H3JVE8_WOLCO|nr:nucleoside triphosphate hydrolase protein [Wolfiporia cocos MD-104 SS10]
MPVDRSRQRYNAKARQSAVGSHKKKGKRKNAEKKDGEQIDTNAEIVVPKSQEQKELSRKERLKQELLAQSDSKANSKKKKRLEKYIEKKLKQEERLVLFEKLSKSQAQLSTALQLQSSSTLGTGKATTHKDLIDKQEDKEVRKAINGLSAKGKRHRQPLLLASDSSDEDEDEVMLLGAAGSDNDGKSKVHESEEGKSRANPVVIVDSGFSTTTLPPEPSPEPVTAPSTSAVGSALKRNPDGTVVAPKISKKKAKRAKPSRLAWNVHAHGPVTHDGEGDSDTSFDSSDSEYDTDSDEEDAQSAADDEEEEEWGGIQTSDKSESALSEEYDEEGGEDEEEEEEEEEEEDEDEEEGEEGDDDDEDSSPGVEKTTAGGKRKRGFKEWALKQLSSVKGYVAPIATDSPPAQAPEVEHPAAPPPKKRKTESAPHPGEMRGPLGEDLRLPATSFAKQLLESGSKFKSKGKTDAKPKVVTVARPPEVEQARLNLPIVAEEQPIMEAILLHGVVIICGETGSGKTTQVPQFLYEAGFGSPDGENPGMIGITQPRRVAAISMAARVAQELSLPATRVSYQIRYDATVSPTTTIKFMTDGVLLRELATDFLLAKYSVIIIDEAHERSMNTDILIGVLSRVVRLREEMWIKKQDGVKPLRLIIMSATLRVSDFAENKTLFATPPPIIDVPARQHPVTVHFSRRTSSDYVTEAIRKASKIHARLPPGGILIFLTGQNEIAGVCRKLEARYGKKALEERRKRRRAAEGSTEERGALAVAEQRVTVDPAQADVEAEDVDLGEQEDLALDIDGDVTNEIDDADALDTDDEDINNELGIDTEETDTPMHIVPLYALLPSEKQMQVFRPPPTGSRLVVVATNVAETSLTIPDIRYVVDCGRAKERRYDVTNGVQAFQVSWISKASAAQRAGRAGRTGPGHCYRLYSSALYEHYFDQFSKPEILRVPIEGIVLQMKSMNIDAVVNFPFPTPPDRTSMRKAEQVLIHLGALQASASTSMGGAITEVGKAMSLFPLSPRYSRMLVSGRQHGCLPYVIAIVSALSVGDPFLREEALRDDDEESDEEMEELSHLTSKTAKAKEARRLQRRAFFQSQQLHASLGNSTSDIFRMLSIVGAYEFTGGGHKFCADHFVRQKAMEEIHKLRAQISNIVQANFPDLDTGFVANLQPPSTLQIKVLRQLIAAGFIDQVAVRKDIVERGRSSGEKFTTSKGVAYKAMGVDEDVFIHPTSVLANSPPPDYVVYLEVVKTSRVWIKGLTVVNATWLSTLGKSLCTNSKAIKAKDGRTMVIPHFGPAGWELPAIESHD